MGTARLARGSAQRRNALAGSPAPPSRAAWPKLWMKAPTRSGRRSGAGRARTQTVQWTVCAWRGVGPLARRGLPGRPWQQGCQPLQELHRRHHQLRRAVAPGWPRQPWPSGNSSAASERHGTTWTAVTRCPALSSTACARACALPVWPKPDAGGRPGYRQQNLGLRYQATVHHGQRRAGPGRFARRARRGGDDGMLDVNSGYASFGGALGNVLLAFSVEGN